MAGSELRQGDGRARSVREIERELADVERHLADAPPHSGRGQRDDLAARADALRRELARARPTGRG